MLANPTFHCPICKKRKPVFGRVKNKFTGRRDSRGRKMYDYKCADCAKKEE